MMNGVFNCCSDSNLPVEEFLRTLDQQTQDPIDSEVEICGKTFYVDSTLEEVDIFVRMIRKNWCHLQSAVVNNVTITPEDLVNTRCVINSALNVIIRSLKKCECDSLRERLISSTNHHLKTFLPLVLQSHNLENDVYVKLMRPSVNKHNCPIYQYFHTFQDVHYYLLLFYHVSGQRENLQEHLGYVVKELVVFSEIAYMQSSDCAFICDCNKFFWVIIQILCESLGEDTFWQVFNKSVENSSGEYVLWLLKDVANLQAHEGEKTSPRIKPNLILLESCLKNVIISSELRNTVLPTLRSIQPVVGSLWLKWGKIEIYQTLWEHFSKRLNSCRLHTDCSLVEVLDLVESINCEPKRCEVDFELFVGMLATHLSAHPSQWIKIKGRIYSQLGPNKLKDLQSGGIFNVLLLFMSLMNVNFDELSKKFVGFVSALPAEKKQTLLVWTLYMAFIVRSLREHHDVKDIVTEFTKMLEDASTDTSTFYLIRVFVKDFDQVIKPNVNLQLHQSLLINTWIHKYMTSCHYKDLVALLNTLLCTLEKVNQVWWDWESSFKTHVYPALKYSRNTPEISGAVAAKIALLSPALIKDAFLFYNSDAIPPKVSANFLCVILEDHPNSSFTVSSEQEGMALQTWAKFCLLTREGYNKLTRNIIKLEIFPEFLKQRIAHADDPLCDLIDCIGSHFQADVVTLCEGIFGNAERWVKQYLTHREDENVVLRIYTCIGVALLKLGRLLYNKHKSNCPFERLITPLILPTELLKEKPLNRVISQSVRKTWQTFFEAALKLRTPGDSFIDRILEDMVVRYLPLFTADSPLLKCLEDEANAEVILEKISNAFFKWPTKQAESNVFKALKLVDDFVQSSTSVLLLKLVINKSVFGLFEVIMFHNHTAKATAVVLNVVSSELFPQLRPEFEEVVAATTEKHLAFNSPKYFELLGHLARIVPDVMRAVTPRIKLHLGAVERRRGVGYDKSLRLQMERFDAALSKIQ